jgi:CRP-like cAMP-binding protein
LIGINRIVDDQAMNLDPAAIQNLRQTALIATLRQCRMFADLAREDIEAVAAGCVTRSLEKGETLFREGETAEGFYIVQAGQISIYRVSPDGREQIICVFRPPESFAEVILAAVESYPASAVALEASRVILVRKSRFRELICRKPELSLHMLASMSMHLKHLVQTLHDARSSQIETRLAEWLLKHGPATAPPEPASFVLPMPKKVLAGQLGVTSETLSRTFARFREEGILRVTGANIVLLDRPALQAYAAGEL